MKKALKIVGTLFLTIFRGGGHLLHRLDATAVGAAVCDNVARIMKKEANVDMSAKDRDACIRDAETQPQFGIVPWVKRLECVRDAETSGDLKACDGPRSL